MKVLKFGGTSVGSIIGIQNIKRIAEAGRGPVIVVVSALKTVTDNLIEATRLASEGNADYKRLVKEIVAAHHDLIDAVIGSEKQRTELKEKLQSLFSEMSDLLHGVCLIQDVTPRTSDAILSYGERCSSLCVEALIEGAVRYDSREFIKTEKREEKVMVNYTLTNRLIQERFANLQTIAVIPGFIASDATSGITTTLGRGGSDYTAAIVAAALNVETLEIWTDVDGFMTADPRIVPNAYTIETLSYNEAMELCNFGAKVVYPPTIYPVRKKNIPIYIRNTFRPEFPGSLITSEAPAGRQAVRGLSAIKDTSLVNVSGMSMVGVIGVNRRIFSTLAAHGLSVFMVAQTSSETSTTICLTPRDAETACRVLDQEFAKEIATGAMNPMQRIDGLSTIAIVGEQMKNTQGIAGKLFSVLGRNGISVLSVAQGASETNISAIIDKQHLRKASNVIHDSFFLSDYQVINLFLCGVGGVGSSLLSQLQEQRQELMDTRRLKLNLVGLANSKRAIFNAEGLDMDGALDTLKQASPCDKDHLLQAILDMNLYNSVFVDCTASSDIASTYQTLLEHNISVVTANKIAASAPYDTYASLKNTALSHGVKFLYETNVGAGLPIIKTIDDLRASGDRVIEIQAVLSGTLNYIFNNLAADRPLSTVIRQAKELKISEPDPRIDLCGKDVLRKLVILVREAGERINQEDVHIEPFIPQEYFEGTTADFMDSVSQLDAQFEQRRQSVAQARHRLRFVARWANGEATVSLVEVDENHPFYKLEDSNNVVVLTTERYRRYPMIIQGYGAGAEVTAAGVFADIMRVANI